MTSILLVLFGILFVLVCLFLIAMVLSQPGRSGGLASMQQQAAEAPTALTETLGVADSDKKLFKWTMTVATTFFVLTFVLTFLGNAGEKTSSSLNLPDAPAPASTSGMIDPGAGTVTVGSESAPAGS